MSAITRAQREVYRKYGAQWFASPDHLKVGIARIVSPANRGPMVPLRARVTSSTSSLWRHRCFGGEVLFSFRDGGEAYRRAGDIRRSRSAPRERGRLARERRCPCASEAGEPARKSVLDPRRQARVTLPPFFTLSPDWVCEAPSTAALDRSEKLPIYLREQIAHVWLVDPLVKTLEIFRLDGATYRLMGTFTADTKVRGEPFDAVEIDLAALWAR